VGAYGVIGALTMLILMPVFGLNQGAQPIIGYNFGAGHISRVRHALKLAVLVATAIVCTGFAVAQTIPTVLIRAFARDPGLVAIGVRGMHICLAMLPLVGFQIVSANFFQAIGKAKTSLTLSLLRQVIVLIPPVLILPPIIGLDGVWAAGPIADGIATIVTAAVLAWHLHRMGRGEHTVEVRPESFTVEDPAAT